MNKQDVRRRIEEIGIIPSIRVSTTEDALFAAEAVGSGGIPILEVTLTVPEAMRVIEQVVKRAPDTIVGAGSVHDVDVAKRCLDAGAKFISSDGLDQETVRFAVQRDIVVIPGTLTPTGVINAWKLGPEFVKVVPCGHIGGDSYIRDLKSMFPQIPLIAAGGVSQRTAFNFILAGAVALGVGGELIPREAIRKRQPNRIAELARRFLDAVSSARAQ
ncbi:MAG TPA: bifunctional 4-hydroxy-2-oxoglutarate aldolase/2-dehydro-3-deoxy-phosphogluconate aldolase [Candidatus Sulfotelmatobacter sp.]|nr:bifunctional 4-hydroxy-2-oxoglutarate aldolase/2-dehydro-3-deoxy-phosphogluconate aldolase [Candidatus Sulfotelmatobacter sp.]